MVSIALYAQTLEFGFVHDDNSQIVANPQVQSWRLLPLIFSTDVWNQKGEGHLGFYYRPMFMLWLLLVRSLAGLNPLMWHLSSMLLHAATTFLVFSLGLALLDSVGTAVVIGLLFAVHAIHIEAVSWISAANELLYSGFFLGSLLLFNRVLVLKDAKRQDWVLSVLLWTAALFSKETAIVLLPIFLLWAYFKVDASLPIRQKLTHVLKNGWPFILACALYLVARSLVLHRFAMELGRHTWREVFFTGVELVRFYTLKLLLPVHLSPFYGNAVSASPSIKVWVTVLLGLAIIALAIWIGLRREPVVALAIWLIVLPIVPVLVGVRIFRDGDLAHDRYLYLPSVGLCLLLGLLFNHFWTKTDDCRWAVATVAGVILVTMLGVNLTQQRYYRDDETFYKRGLEVGPENALVEEFLGSYYFRQGKPDLGLQQFRQAYDQVPDNPEVGRRLAYALFETGHYSEVEPVLTKLVRNSRTADAGRKTLNLALAQTQMHLGKFGQAESILKALIETDDNMPKLHRTLGTLYEIQGRLYDASHEYEREYQVSGDVQAHHRAILLATRH